MCEGNQSVDHATRLLGSSHLSLGGFSVPLEGGWLLGGSIEVRMDLFLGRDLFLGISWVFVGLTGELWVGTKSNRAITNMHATPINTPILPTRERKNKKPETIAIMPHSNALTTRKRSFSGADITPNSTSSHTTIRPPNPKKPMIGESHAILFADSFSISVISLF